MRFVLILKLMKRIVLIASLFLIGILPLNSQEFLANSLFDQANRLYSQNDFRTALNLYLEIADSGYTSPELLMNIGNSYFKTNDYARAILYYEKALLLDPSNQDIIFNLSKAQAYTIDRIEIIPEFFLMSQARRVISSFTSNQWALASVVLLFLTLIVLYFYLISKSQSRKVTFFSIGVVFLILSISAYSFSHKTRSYVEKSDRAIVMEPTVTVKGSPDLNGVTVFIIHEGTKISLVRSIDEWVEIKLSDGKQGWVRQSSFETI